MGDLDALSPPPGRSPPPSPAPFLAPPAPPPAPTPIPAPDPRLIYNTLRLLSTSLSSLLSIIPLCTSPATSNARPRYQTTLSRHVFSVRSFSSSSPPPFKGFFPPLAHRRKKAPLPPCFRCASFNCASYRRVAAAESCWIENCRSRRRDLDS